ncbi:type I-C CRISPR-associated protein Cas8c/Csd1 [Anaerovorax odorimutans]|uniref:Type I-C CRISPR-associated protein Cas8c/Csd1 n=1 Tax=Anaerovorax odorimutans TaxID=109327 RepID=A0ABT1RLI8_9FIRM|nr:type I-C CRISPR-associated protein Cas8c/Csd1 [Anaerovorax odorimutans]MCQ4636032.1 type I-C CRISPR-associated protein Cas8c/Csd1 [Anaerovorax odorimutans]
MSLFKMLYGTYESNEAMVANPYTQYPLCPVSHMTASVQIEMSIDLQGNIVDARTITDREDGETIIPVTEESASRSSGTAPHPLSDNLTYLAGDYGDYAASKKETDTGRQRFDAYIKALESWISSGNSHEKVQAIYNYLSQKHTIKDLQEYGVVNLDENGKLTKDKIAGKTYDKCMVRFIVLGAEEPEECWLDKSLIKAYQEYYFGAKEGREDICYLTAKPAAISDNHPKGILAASYGAKLLSANDNSDFTYRGRFQDEKQAYAVSYEASQKAHNALKWLAKQQGYTVGNRDKRTYICWSLKDLKIPEAGRELDLEYEEDAVPNTVPQYRQRLRKFLGGYEDGFDATDDIALLTLEAATTGRLSVTYYNELKAKDYFSRIRSWYETCCWQFTTFDSEKKPRQEVKTPAIARIVNYAFGTEQGNMVKVDDKLMIMQYQRLFHCIVDRQRIPRDFVHAIFQRASHPMGYTFGNRERILSTACALIAKYYKDKGVELEMNLQKNLEKLTGQDRRSFLYGMLLAVYEKAERSTYDRDEKREPNAIRLQASFVQHPGSARMTIEQALIPYYQRMAPRLRDYFRKEIQEISVAIGEESRLDQNKGLNELYLTGYWLERAELSKKKEDA